MQNNEAITPENIRIIANSFQQSRALLTAIELEIFTILDTHLLPSSDVAKKIGSDPRATDRLMNALASIGLLKKLHGKFYNSELSKKYLVKGKPDYMGNLHHTNHIWDSWSTLTESVKQGTSVYKRSESKKENWREDFISAMHYRAQHEAKIISLLIDFKGVNRMLDIGGGSGAFTYQFLSINPDMSAVIFDLPEVIPITRKYGAESNLGDRIQYREGNYLTDDFEKGYDMIFLSAIVHINSYDQNKDLINRCADALNPDGQIIIRDFIMKEDRTEPVTGAFFALNMLVATECGDTFTEKEMTEWFVNSGINSVVKKETSFGSHLLIGRKK